jgi:hypothetical protein
MSDFYVDGPRESISDEQQSILVDNLRGTIELSMAQRYGKALVSEATFWERCATLDDENAERFKQGAEKMRQAASAEVPFAFSLEPSNMAVSVHTIKVNPNTGEKIDGSEIQVGLTGGLSNDGTPNKRYGFSVTDLKFAVERLREQKRSGLVYGLRDSSGFISGY